MSEQFCDIDADQDFLGAALANNGRITDVIDWLRAEHFIEPLHGRLYKVMCRLWLEGRAFVPENLAPHFPDEPPIGKLSFVQYLGHLMAANTATHKVAVDRARLVKELAERRGFTSISDHLQEMAKNRALETLAIGNEAMSALNEIVASSRPKRSCFTAYEAAGNLLDDLESGVSRLAIPTGLADLDRVTGGWHYNELAIIGARPSMGKSTFMTESALNAARDGKGVLLFSLEMSQSAVSARMLSSLVWNRVTPIPYTDILKHKVETKHDRDRLRQAHAKLKGWPIEVDDQGGLTVSEIMARSRQAAVKFQREGKTLDLVLVDHIGKIRPSSRYAGNANSEIGEITNWLAVLSKDLGVAVVAASQLNRELTKRDNKRPQLSDLRESGHIEEDADLVAFIHREVYYTEDSGNGVDAEIIENIQNDMEFILRKNRNGPLCTVKLFTDMISNVVRNAA
jgi:replicative DNA helicase